MQYPLMITTAMLLVLSLWLNPARAASNPFEFHADANMVHPRHGAVAAAWGYLNVKSFRSGQGRIDVMFSNGSPLEDTRFNARVRFLDDAGGIVREEHFASHLSAADSDGAMETRLSRPVHAEDFVAVEVDFYLTDLPPMQQARLH